MSGLEVLPIQATLYIPENKVSAWVSKKEDEVPKDKSKEHQGKWVVEGYTLDKKKRETEIWIFYDDDEMDIDRRVLENNPLKGIWGYAPNANPRKPKPNDMWFFPPKSAKCKIPSDRKEYNHMGTWVKPTFKRDFSQLGSNSAGFMNVSGPMKIAKGEKHSVAGKWNMLGYNDDVVRGKKKKKEGDIDPRKGRWEIFVRKPSGSRFPISVIAGNKISQCKKKILEEKGIPVEEQRLSFNKTPLKDQKTLVGCGIANGDTIDLGPMIVYVKNQTEKKFTFQVDPDGFVESLKEKIEKREGTPIDEQHLFFKGIELTDGNRLHDFNVKHKSILLLEGPEDLPTKSPEIKCPDEVEIEMPDMDKIAVPVQRTTTMSDIKDHVEKTNGIPKSKQRVFFMDNDEEVLDDNSPIFDPDRPVHHNPLSLRLEKDPENIEVRTPYGRSFYFDPADDTVKDLKRKIAKAVGLPIKDLHLIDDEDEILEDNDGMPGDGDVLNVAPLVEVKIPNKTKVKVPMLPKMTVEDIKDVLEEKTGEPKANQRIFFFDSKGDELEDSDPVEKAGIEPNTLLEMRPDGTNQVVVKTPDGRSFFFDFDPTNDTVKDMKRKVAKTIGLPIKDLSLFDDDNKMLADDNSIPDDGDVLNVAPLIEVEIPDKNTKVKVPLLPTMNVEDIKGVIEEKTGEPKANQRIFFFDSEGNELDNSVPVEKFGIDPGSVLEMRPVPPEENQITLRAPNGRSFFFDFDPGDDTVKDIKTRIAREFGVPVKDLPTLLLDEEELDDNHYPTRGAIFDFEPNEIGVELPDGTRIQVPTIPMQTIGEVKDYVEVQTGVPKCDQRIFFFDNDSRELDDNVTLAKAKIKTGTPLKIFSPDEPKESKEIKIKDPSGRVFYLNIDSDEPVKDIKDKIAEKIGFPIGGFRLDNKEWNDDDDDDIPLDEAGFPVRNGGILEVDPPEVELELPHAKKMKLELLPTMTLKDIQEKLIEEEGIDLSITEIKQRMFFFDGIVDLDDDSPLKKLKFNSRHKSLLSSTKIKIIVEHWNGNFYKLDAKSDWYIDDIRPEIHRLSGVPPEQQNITYDGKPVTEEIKLMKQGIANGSTLTLEPMSVRMSVPGKKKPIRFEVKPSDTVDKIKRKALKKVKEGNTTKLTYCLVAGGQELDDNESLEKYKIQHGDLLTLEEFKVRVMHWTGEIFDVDGVGQKDTIESLKKRILKKEGIPIDDQRLLLDSKVLEDKNTLKKEKVGHRSVLVLEPLDAEIESPEAEKKKMKATKTKKFKERGDNDDIMPVMPDWKRRIFFFDSDDTFDAHIDLVIMDWKGEKFTIDKVLLNTKVSDIKRKILALKGIGKKNQIIKFDGKRLDDGKTLLEAGVGHRSLLVLESPLKNTIATPSLEKLDTVGFIGTVPTKIITDITITVQHWNGDTFEISPAPNDYIDDVKDLIHDLKKIPLEQLRISFQGEFTDDTANLEEQNIVDGSVLVLEPMRILLELPKKKKQIPLEVALDQKLSQVKKKVAKMSRVPLDSICIMFDGEEVEYANTILNCGIEHEDILKVEAFEIKVMHWSGEVCTADKLTPSSTPYDVKQRIAKLKSIPDTDQILSLEGKVLNDMLRLKDQGVKHKTTLVLQPPEDTHNSPVKERMHLSFSWLKQSRTDLDRKLDGFASTLTIKVQHWDGTVFTMDAEPSDYVDDLKETIFSSQKIPVNQQRLEFEGEVIGDDLDLEEQGIVDGCTLILTKMKIFVCVSEVNETVEVEVNPNDTIQIVKKKLAKQLKLSTEHQCLVMAGEELVDAKTVSHYEISDSDVLHLEVFAVKIFDWNGDVIEVDGINSNSIVDDFKKQIEKATSIPAAEQLLKVKDKPVIETLRLKDQGIKHGSIVVLDLVSGVPKTYKSPKRTKVSLRVSESGNNKICFEDDGDEYDSDDADDYDDIDDDDEYRREESQLSIFTDLSESQSSKKSDTKETTKAKTKKARSSLSKATTESSTKVNGEACRRDESQSSGLTDASENQRSDASKDKKKKKTESQSTRKPDKASSKKKKKKSKSNISTVSSNRVSFEADHGKIDESQSSSLTEAPESGRSVSSKKTKKTKSSKKAKTKDDDDDDDDEGICKRDESQSSGLTSSTSTTETQSTEKSEGSSKDKKKTKSSNGKTEKSEKKEKSEKTTKPKKKKSSKTTKDQSSAKPKKSSKKEKTKDH